jgi:Domain of unknown function (DUF4188)
MPRTTGDITAMAEVINGRRTAGLDDDVVVFLIGMRINRWRRVRSWLPAFRAMPRMLRELGADPDLGLLRVQSFWAGRVIMAVQYWRSFEQLEAFARSKDHEHLPAWREFNRLVRDNGDVGIFHETYRVGPGTAETFYGNMPPFGLAAAVGVVPVEDRGQTAARRMGTRTTDEPAVAPY